VRLLKLPDVVVTTGKCSLSAKQKQQIYKWDYWSCVSKPEVVETTGNCPLDAIQSG